MIAHISRPANVPATHRDTEHQPRRHKCSIKENLAVEWSFLLGWTKARPRNISEGEMPGVFLCPLLYKIRSRISGPGSVQRSLHNAVLQASFTPAVDAVFARYIHCMEIQYDFWTKFLECPLHTQIFKQASIFNWTATYRRDSTVVAPYERWQYYNSNVRTREQERDYAANKTKQVAWFVSNCGAR